MEHAGQYYPGSFFKLLLLAIGIVALPLLFAIAGAAMFVELVTGQSRGAVAQAVQAARGSRLLMENVTGMERVLRQFLILGDRSLLSDHAELRKVFKSLTGELSLLPLDEEQLGALNRTIESEQALFEKLSLQPRTAAKRKELVEGYVLLSGHAQGVLAMSNALIDREVNNLSRGADAAQRQLVWLIAIALSLGLLLAIGVTMVIARPIGQIEKAVLRLGAGEFEKSVQITGPADLKFLGSRLDWLRRRLAELEQDRESFLRHVSHELKTPLTSVREGAELLSDGTMGALEPAQQDVANILREKSRHLQTLIERLLEYQRAGQSLGRMVIAPLHLDRVVASVAEAQRFAAEMRGIRIEASLAPARIMGDADKLRVVADNLISNAMKFTPVGSAVRVRVAPLGEEVLFEVRDSGPGVPIADRERVFDLFYRGAQEPAGRVPGTGIGLAIARELVAAHRGKIELADDGAPGACFRVVLPAA
jgi:two-component system sensor histidine kinase GlrK